MFSARLLKSTSPVTVFSAVSVTVRVSLLSFRARPVSLSANVVSLASITATPSPPSVILIFSPAWMVKVSPAAEVPSVSVMLNVALPSAYSLPSVTLVSPANFVSVSVSTISHVLPVASPLESYSFNVYVLTIPSPLGPVPGAPSFGSILYVLFVSSALIV